MKDFVCAMPFGVILLTGSFVLVSGLVLGLADGSSQLIYWAIDFGLFLVTAILSLHLALQEVNQVGGLLFAFAAVGYLIKSFNTIFLGSSWTVQYNEESSTDIERAVYGLTFASFVLWTLSMMLLYIFVQAAWMMIEDVHGACGMMPAKFSLLALVLSTLVLSVGSIWSAIIGPYDSSGDEQSPQHFANILFWVAQLTWYLSLSSFLISAASVWGSLARDIGGVRLWGMPTSWAAGGLVCSQLVTAGILVFAVLNGLRDRDEAWTPVDADGVDYPHLIFNYAMMMTLFFVHNMVDMVFRTLPTDFLCEDDGLDKGGKETKEPDTERESDNSDCDEEKPNIEESSCHGVDSEGKWTCFVADMTDVVSCHQPNEPSASEYDIVEKHSLEDADMDEKHSLEDAMTTEGAKVEEGVDKDVFANKRNTNAVLTVASMGMINAKSNNAGVEALVRMATMKRQKAVRLAGDNEILPGGPSGSKLVLHMVTSMDDNVVEV